MKSEVRRGHTSWAVVVGGSVGRATASDSRGPRFEYSHRQTNYIEHLLSTFYSQLLKKEHRFENLFQMPVICGSSPVV